MDGLIAEMTGDFQCPLSGDERQVEYLQISPHTYPPHTKAEVPRVCAEAIGVDCSALERGGTIWFTNEQSERLAQHRHYVPVGASGAPTDGDDPPTQRPEMAPNDAEVAAAEERGAAKERERIAAELLAVDPVEWALAGQHAGVEAAKIVRGSS